MAGDEGRAAQVPVPDPQRVDLALVRVQPQHRRPVHGHRHRRRADAAAAGRHQIRHGMAERYEIVIDFSKYRPGQRVVLRNDNKLPNNIDYDNTDKVMAFDVVGRRRRAPRTTRTPTILNPDMPGHEAHRRATPSRRGSSTSSARTAAGRSTARPGTTSSTATSRRTLADPKLGTTSRSGSSRTSRGGWFHPVHIHLVDFKILDRNGKPPYPYELGPKDVVYVGENETVRVIMTFGPPDRPLHDALPQPRPRGPRHDGPVQRVGDIEHGGHDPRLEDAARPLPFPDFHDEDMDVVETPDDPAGDDDSSGSSESGS